VKSRDSDSIHTALARDEFKRNFDKIVHEAKEKFIEKTQISIAELRFQIDAALSKTVDRVNKELALATVQLQQKAATYQTDLQVKERDIEGVAVRTSENIQSILTDHARRIGEKTEEMVSSTINRVLYDHIDDRLDRAVADFIERGENASQHLTNKQIALRYGWSIREVKRRKRRG